MHGEGESKRGREMRDGVYKIILIHKVRGDIKVLYNNYLLCVINYLLCVYFCIREGMIELLT